MSLIDDFLAGGTGENAPSGHTADDGHDHSGAPWAKGLNAELSPRVSKLIDMYRDRGVDLRVVSGHRDIEEQRQLYAQGRTKPGKIVTWIKPENSRHVHGDAVDVVPFENGKPNWQAPESFWQQLGKDGVALGLEWGGNWKKTKDRPHFQLPKGGPPATSAGLSMAMGPRVSNLRRDMRQYYGGSVIDDFLSGGTSASAAKVKPAKNADSRADWVASMLDYARPAAQRLGLDPAFLVAHAAQETGWGKGVHDNNYFNITGSYHGKARARGDTNAAGKKITQKFRVYDSPEQSFSDLADLLERRYKGVRGARDALSYGSALKAGGYAEDPGYAKHIAERYAELQRISPTAAAPVRTASASRSVIDEFLGL